MTQQLIAALLMNFGAIAGAMLMRNPRWNWSLLSRKLGWLLFLVGGPAGLLAIYLFVEERGWGYGLLLWFGSSGLSATALGFMFDGLRTIAGTVAAIIGVGVFIYSMT